MTTWTGRTTPAELEARWIADGFWDDRTLGELLHDGLDAKPDVPCVVYSDVRPWSGTFADLQREALQLAGGLQARGVGPGDAVAFQLPNWHEAITTFWAAAFLGATVVPIVHSYGPKEVGYIAERTPLRAYITATQFLAIDFLATLDQVRDRLAPDTVIGIVGLDEPDGDRIPFTTLLDAEPLAAPVHVDPSSPALFAYTSGTTADPKGVVHTHRSIGAETRQLGATQEPRSLPHLVGLPVGHAMGMLGALLMPVWRGQPINLIDLWNPARILELMVEHDLTSGAGATYFLLSLLDHPDCTPRHLDNLRFIGMGGAAVPAAVVDRATAEGISIVRMYGSTEHPSITGSLHTDPEVERGYSDGRPLPGVEIRLVDEQGAEVPVGVPGEILSRGPDCCAGYTDPAITATAFDEDGWFHTGDVGVLDEAGCLHITDRLKDIIIRGGENVSAVEVEEVVAHVPGIAEVVVVAAPDDRYGERVCAVVRPLDPASPPNLDDIRAAVGRAGLARQKWPEQLVVVDDLPRTPSGKVQKAVLRRRLADPAASPVG
jgi:acyl-CoA synthetase (AMP-forming)/AMP-acid ligase II